MIKESLKYIPETFQSLESSKIAFAHIDVDIYKCNHGLHRLYLAEIEYGWNNRF